MKCKNCLERMGEKEQDQEDGLITMIRLCDKCGWSSKTWYDLEDCVPTNVSWLDDKSKDVE